MHARPDRLLRIARLGAALAAFAGGVARAEPPLAPDELGQLDAALLDRAGPMKVRLEAALILARAGGPEAVPALVDALGDPEFPVRAGASLALGQMGDARAAEGLVVRLGDPEKFVRDEATEALAQLVRRNYGRAIEAQMRRTDPVRRSKLVALGMALGPGAGDGLLAQGIADPDPAVRASATAALAGWSPPEAQRFLLSQLQSEVPAVRSAAARLAGQRQVSLAVPALMAILVAPEETSETVEAARGALRELVDHIDVPHQLELAKHGQAPERVAALAALAALRDPAAYALLLGTLDDPNLTVRGAAALDLGVLGDPRAIQKLSVLAGREENAPIRRTVQTALGMLAPEPPRR